MKKLIFAGDTNLTFDKNLESVGRESLSQKHYLSEIIKFNKSFNLCDICRVCNPQKTIHIPTNKFYW